MIYIIYIFTCEERRVFWCYLTKILKFDTIKKEDK